MALRLELVRNEGPVAGGSVYKNAEEGSRGL